MSRKNLSEALAARSPLARREVAKPAGRPTEDRPGSGTGEPVAAGEVAPHRPDASGIVEGAVASRAGEDDELVVLVAARPAQPGPSAAPTLPARGTPGLPGGQSWQGQAALERWVAAQRELWDAWFALAEHSLHALGPGPAVGWGQPVLRAWQAATRQLLDGQAAWLRCWAAPPLGHRPDRHDRAGGGRPPG